METNKSRFEKDVILGRRRENSWNFLTCRTEYVYRNAADTSNREMPEKAKDRDEDLLRRIAAGDEESFRLFYARHQRVIFRFALHMTSRADAAEEIVQEAFMTLIREAGKFDAKRGAPQAFLYGIARNHVRRLLERERRYEPLLTADSASGETREIEQIPAPDEHLLCGLTRAEVVLQVQSALGLLPPHYREVIILCDLLERDYASAARLLECPIGTVRSRLARGREMLAAKLRATPARRSASGRG